MSQNEWEERIIREGRAAYHSGCSRDDFPKRLRSLNAKLLWQHGWEWARQKYEELERINKEKCHE